ncbi:MAG TPA: type III pantothenate kinase [Egicoccus sp.]|nr:type III pantothenate kinase [Egicoccus sp.]HSK24744.1 type III pantothenate kinase [Egicoccus sp.]
MLLAIDVGNSNTVVGVFDGDDLVEHWRLSTDVERTPDELALSLAGFLGFAGLDLRREIDGLVAGSVVPPVTEVVREMAQRYLDFAPVIVEPGVRTGISIRHDHPQDIGADRIVNAVAAHDRFDGAAIVVDFGTATSFDAVSADGAFVGGAIAPGVHISAEALVQRAARLPKVETVAPPSPIGRSTVTALQSGIVYGFAGQVDGIVRRIAAELGGAVTTIATGGCAPAVLSACETIDTYDPWLTLDGLRIIWGRNQ